MQSIVMVLEVKTINSTLSTPSKLPKGAVVIVVVVVDVDVVCDRGAPRL